MATRPATAPAAAPTTLGLPLIIQLMHDPGQGGGGGGGRRDDEGVDGDGVGRAGATGVEAEPAEPEDARAEHDERDVVRLHRLFAVALALAVADGGGERGGAGVDVDGRATREVEALDVGGDPAVECRRPSARRARRPAATRRP